MQYINFVSKDIGLVVFKIRKKDLSDDVCVRGYPMMANMFAKC